MNHTDVPRTPSLFAGKHGVDYLEVTNYPDKLPECVGNLAYLLQRCAPQSSPRLSPGDDEGGVSFVP